MCQPGRPSTAMPAGDGQDEIEGPRTLGGEDASAAPDQDAADR